MVYEDLKKTILDNYGGQNNVPDYVYNVLYKFKLNGQDALDARDSAILSEAKNYKLPEVTEPSTMEFAAFAHPTTPEKAAKWAQENAEKDTYKVDQLAGRSASGLVSQPSVMDYLKATPDMMLSNLQDMYGGLREAAATGIAPVVATVASGLEKIGWKDKDTVPYIDPEGVERVRTLPDRTIYQRSLENIEGAKQGEGVTGLLSDPLNAAILLPGLGEEVLASKLGQGIMASRIGSALGPTAMKGILGGIEGAGYGVLGSKLDRTREGSDLGDAVLAGGLGGAFGSTIGSMLKSNAVDNFPGVDKLEKTKYGGKKNTGMNELSEAERIKVYEDLPMIAGRGSYFDLGNKYMSHAGEGFSKADAIFDDLLEKYGYPYGGISTGTMKKIIKDRMLKESKANGILQNLVDERQIDDFINDRMGRIEFTAKQTPRKVNEEFRQLAGAPELKEILDNVIPISNLGSILGQLNTDVGRLMSKNPTAESKMALVARNAIADNIRGPLSEINPLDMLATGSLPGHSYGEVLEQLQPGANARYKLGKKLLSNIASQVETGPSIRLGVPSLGETGPHMYLRTKSNYVLPNLEYKAGKFFSNPLGASIAARIPEGAKSFQEWKEDRKKAK